MPDTSPSLAAQRVSIAREERRRRRTGDTSAVVEARRTYAAAKLEAIISQVVNSAPPLTPAQRDKLALLLRGSGG